MKKILVSTLFIGIFGAYAASQYASPATAPTDPSIAAQSSSSASVSGSTPPPDSSATQPTAVANNPAPTPQPAAKPLGQYIDGTYTGLAADAYYGTIQVRATVSGGKLADVAFLQYPNDRRESQYINSQAMPLLRQEAIQAQDANVDGVSGATDSSAAFRESLSSALTKARNS